MIVACSCERRNTLHILIISQGAKLLLKTFFIAAWPGLCKSLCFKVQIKAVVCSYFNKRVKERFCHEPPTLHF